MEKLKIKGIRKVFNEKTIDTFRRLSFDDKTIILEVKESGNIILRSIYSVIGWTNDSHLAFNILNNSVPVSTFKELFKNRK